MKHPFRQVYQSLALYNAFDVYLFLRYRKAILERLTVTLTDLLQLQTQVPAIQAALHARLAEQAEPAYVQARLRGFDRLSVMRGGGGTILSLQRAPLGWVVTPVLRVHGYPAAEKEAFLLPRLHAKARRYAEQSWRLSSLHALLPLLIGEHVMRYVPGYVPPSRVNQGTLYVSSPQGILKIRIRAGALMHDTAPSYALLAILPAYTYRPGAS